MATRTGASLQYSTAPVAAQIVARPRITTRISLRSEFMESILLVQSGIGRKLTTETASRVPNLGLFSQLNKNCRLAESVANVVDNIRMAVVDPLNKLMRHVRRTLSSLPSSAAQLIYLSSLRDPYTGRYLHEGWTTIGSPEEVNWAISHIHTETFSSVVELKLEVLCGELKEHFESLGGSVQQMAATWLELEPYREMQPRRCSPVERRLFISQMRAALGVLVRSPDLAVLGEQAASQSRRPAPPPPPHRGN